MKSIQFGQLKFYFFKCKPPINYVQWKRHYILRTTFAVQGCDKWLLTDSPSKSNMLFFFYNKNDSSHAEIFHSLFSCLWYNINQPQKIFQLKPLSIKYVSLVWTEAVNLLISSHQLPGDGLKRLMAGHLMIFKAVISVDNPSPKSFSKSSIKIVFTSLLALPEVS